MVKTTLKKEKKIRNKKDVNTRSPSKKSLKKTATKKEAFKRSVNKKIKDPFMHRPIKLKKMIKKITPQIIIPKKSFLEKKFVKNISSFFAILSAIFFLILMFVEKTASYSNFFLFSLILLWYIVYDPFAKKANNLSYFLTFLTTCIIILFFVVCLIIIREFVEYSLISFVTVSGLYAFLILGFYIASLLSKLTKTKYLSFKQVTFLSAFITIIFLVVLSFSTFFVL
jgi:hypothetical protein